MERLTNPIQEYAWGSYTVLAELLGQPVPSDKPQAELWIGAHPSAPSRLADDTTLADRIAEDPSGTLGDQVVAAYGRRLPFLLKVLAVDQPLSLQVHPDRAQAERGFADEERRGTPVGDPARNYKDSWPKPEILCALTDFEALCGFADPNESAALLGGLGIEDLRTVVATLAAGDLKAAIASLLGWPEDERAELVARVAAAVTDRPWLAEMVRLYPGDMGVVVALLMNHVRLAPGQALYAEPGVAHCYLGGAGVELMANSDNVLRLGLTVKHVAVDELLSIASFAPRSPGVTESLETGVEEHLYPTPAPEFRLSRIDVAGPVGLSGGGPELLLCMDGKVRLSGELTLHRGEAAFVAAADPPVTLDGSGTVYRATVG
jgi:mannose-6-phosphate isomerase